MRAGNRRPTREQTGELSVGIDPVTINRRSIALFAADDLSRAK